MTAPFCSIKAGPLFVLAVLLGSATGIATAEALSPLSPDEDAAYLLGAATQLAEGTQSTYEAFCHAPKVEDSVRILRNLQRSYLDSVAKVMSFKTTTRAPQVQAKKEIDRLILRLQIESVKNALLATLHPVCHQSPACLALRAGCIDRDTFEKILEAQVPAFQLFVP